MKEMYVIVIVLLAPWATINAEWELQCPVTQCPYPPGKYAVNLPHENDCTKFYKCDLWFPIEQDCPLMIPGDTSKRLHYNRRLQVCDWPWTAGCESCPEKDKNDKCNEEPKISNPDDDCNTYFDCVDGKEKKATCPKGTCFSRTCQACVSNRKGGNCDKGDDPCKDGHCDCNNDGDLSEHECNCYLYYECQNHEKIKRECEGGLLFNPKTEKCAPAHEVDCKHIPIKNRY